MSSTLLANNFAKLALNHSKTCRKVSEKVFSIGNRSYCNQVTVSAVPILKKEKTSRAMKAYLERAREHDDFIKSQQQEYQIGKRHLANMMGEDPENFTQEDVDRAIKYLLPSGLFDPKARPLMKPPEEVFPPRKAAEFDEAGRPYHPLFYTGKPNFYQTMFDLVENLNNLNDFEDKMIKKKMSPDPTQKIDMSGSVWISKEKLELSLVEKIMDREYENFIKAMDRLIAHPYSYKVKDFIDKYKKPLLQQLSSQLEIPQVQYDESGRAFVTTYECLRKRARGDVTIRCPGTGQISINGKDIDYFEDKQAREQVIFPLIFTGMLGKVDVEANVAGGGSSGQAGAIRWGVSMGLRCFVDAEMIGKMRLAGLLQRDYRRRERKKYGQEGARRKFTWKKR